MSIIAKKNTGGSYDPIPEGAYPARIYQIIHIGTIPGYQGQLQNKVRITFEFPTELKVFKEENGEQPMVLSQDYTLSFHEKAGLRKVIDACDPKALKTVGEDGLVEEYDIENLLGKACLVTVVHKDGKEGAVYANIANCTIMPKGMTCPPQINPSTSLSYDSFDHEYFNKLPKFLQDKIKSSSEYQWMMADKDDSTPPFENVDLSDIPL